MSKATEPIRITRVQSDKELTLFVEAGYQLRSRDALFVPPLRRDVRHMLDRAHHPFHKHAAAEYFLAWRGGEVVGRVAAIENHAHNEFHNERVAFFGFLDIGIRSGGETMKALLSVVEDWARERKLDEVRGPASFSTNEECGMLIDGFDGKPVVMMPWNPPSWPGMVEAAGYEKARDLYSWFVDEESLGERVSILAKRVQSRFERRNENVVVRSMNMKEFAAELERVRTIYNSAWERNWGFVPMTREEIDYMAKEMKPVIVPELVHFAEVNGEPAAFSFALPDYNEILQFCEGKLGPKQIALFLMLKRHIHGIRMLTMGVVEKFRNRGLETMLIASTITYGKVSGYHWADLSWVLDDNVLVNRQMEAVGARIYRTHRIYRKKLSA